MRIVLLICLVIATILGIYNWIYEREVASAKKRIGLAVPEKVSLLLKINIYISLGIVILLGLFSLFSK